MLRATFWWLLLAVLPAGACGPFDPDDLGGAGQEPGWLTRAATVTHRPGCQTLPIATYALGGTLLLPDGPRAGYVTIRDERIVAVDARRPALPPGAPIVETGAIISPGLIDLHNHVAYNFLPLWNAGRRFHNRSQWPRLASYQRAVRDPYSAVRAEHLCEAIKYGELRALVGGTTSIQGSADLVCTRSWARNIEFVNFCADSIRQHVLPVRTITQAEANRLNEQFQSGQTRAFLVHLAEGIDASSRAELEELRRLGLLRPQVVGIHSTAFQEAQLQEMGRIGMKIVWSPLSNLILYGNTTNVPAALRAGIPVALAPDWSPSGSSNLLAELKVADRVNRELFHSALTDHQLYRMATEIPAAIAALDDKIGRIAPGYFADLLVFRGNPACPYRSLIEARPQDVLLTTVSGKAFYGTPEILAALGQEPAYIPVDACGESRALRVVEDDFDLPGGQQTLADLVAAFHAAGVGDPVPLFDCGEPPAWAFEGVPVPLR